MLHFIQYSQMQGWSVLRHVQRSFGYTDRYPLVTIGEFLRQVRNEITVQDDVEYKQLTVKTKGGGVCLRTTRMGRDIGTKQQWRTSAGQFVISKIDARNGAMGIVSEEMDGAIVTHDFPLFSIDEDRINPQFLLLITTTNAFQQFAQSCSSGTTNRQRINISKFLQQPIPLPTIEEQDEMVEEYNRTIRVAENQMRKTLSMEDAINEYVDTKLQIRKATRKPLSKGLHIFKFSSVSKWGIEFITQPKIFKPIYNQKAIGELCFIGSGGTPKRSNKQYYGGNIPWLKTCELNNGVVYDTEEHITSAGLQQSSAKMYEANSIVIAMYGATIGKTAKLGTPCCTNQACAVLHNIHADIVDIDYLWFYLQCHSYELKKQAYGSAQPNINAQIIAKFMIPLPPLTVQQEIVSHVKAEREKAKTLREEAEALRQKAIEDFESNIFEQQAKESNEQTKN